MLTKCFNASGTAARKGLVALRVKVPNVQFKSVWLRNALVVNATGVKSPLASFISKATRNAAVFPEPAAPIKFTLTPVRTKSTNSFCLLVKSS